MSCTNPPSPPGYGVWIGSVPPVLTAWAISLRDQVAGFPFGYVWVKEYSSQLVLARCDCHAWTFRGGQLITGLSIKGITLYSPRTSAFADVLDFSDPLATPNQTFALFDSANETAPPTAINWGLVALSGGATAAVVALFLLSLRHAGRR